MKYLFPLFIFFLSFNLFSQGCDCKPEPEMSIDYPQMKAVFIGKVTKIVKDDKPRIPESVVYVEVIDAFKGVEKGSTVKVRTNASRAACGYSFMRGQQYLIYANKHIRNGRDWSTSTCARTCHMRDAKNDLIYIIREEEMDMKPSWEDQFRD